MKRNNALDIAKGIGIVLMIVGHMTGMIPLHKFIYQFHMPMFLMFSGYFFDAQKWNSFLAFVTKRFKQLIVPYICFAVVIILVSSMILESDYNLMLTLSQGIPHAIWYLLILFFVEILFFGLNKINNGISFLGVSILVLALMGQILYWTNIKCPYSLSAIPVCTVFYILGFMFRKIAVKIPPPSLPKKVLIANILISLSLVYIYVLVSGCHTELAGNSIAPFGYVTAVVGTFGIVNLSIFIEYNTKYSSLALSWIGKNSIPFIGLNLVFIILCDILIRPYISSFGIYKSMQLIATILMCSLISILVNRYFPWVVGKNKK